MSPFRFLSNALLVASPEIRYAFRTVRRVLHGVRSLCCNTWNFFLFCKQGQEKKATSVTSHERWHFRTFFISRLLFAMRERITSCLHSSIQSLLGIGLWTLLPFLARRHLYYINPPQLFFSLSALIASPPLPPPSLPKLSLFFFENSNLPWHLWTAVCHLVARTSIKNPSRWISLSCEDTSGYWTWNSYVDYGTGFVGAANWIFQEVCVCMCVCV